MQSEFDPHASEFDIHAALAMLVERGGSDLHLKVPSPPLLRIDGDLTPLEGAEPLTPQDTERALRGLLQDPGKLEDFAQESEVDFACTLKNVSRFRINAFRQRGSISLVARAVPFGVRTLDELGLPEVIRTMASEPRGILLVTGGTGSGKSTTVAAMINHINETMPKHIVMVEDPIEFLHRDKRSVINQREVGLDTQSFSHALHAVLRQDPDVIVIGEMRDEETVRAALTAAETGHLVISTLHTNDAPESINRIIDFFPVGHQVQARAMLAGTLRGIVSQRLLPSVNGSDRVAICEILRMTGRVRDMIVDPSQTSALPAVIAEGDYYGMQTFDQALLENVRAGLINLEDALSIASNPNDFKLLVASDGQGSTTMADVGAAGTPSAPSLRPSLAQH